MLESFFKHFPYPGYSIANEQTQNCSEKTICHFFRQTDLFYNSAKMVIFQTVLQLRI